MNEFTKQTVASGKLENLPLTRVKLLIVGTVVIPSLRAALTACHRIIVEAEIV